MLSDLHVCDYSYFGCEKTVVILRSNLILLRGFRRNDEIRGRFLLHQIRLVCHQYLLPLNHLRAAEYNLILLHLHQSHRIRNLKSYRFHHILRSLYLRQDFLLLLIQMLHLLRR